MEEVGLRARHAARTRAAIVEAALDLFQERGFQATTIDEIAARADIAPRTFFRYFPTKEAVLFADSAEERQRMAAALAERPAEEHPFASLVAVLGTFADGMEAEPKDIKLRQRIAAENPGIWAYQRTMLEAEMAETLAGFVAERLGVASTSDPRPQVWAALVMVTFRIGFHVWLDGGQAGGLRSAVESSLAAAAEATSVLTGPLPGV